jgi:hypothetical protein
MASCDSGVVRIALLVLVLVPVTAVRGAVPASQPATRPSGPRDWTGRVVHSPPAPKSGQGVTVLAMVAPDVSGVTLEYQVVEPGAYVELGDPEYARNWTRLAMTQGAASKKHVAYTAEVPAEVQKHRRLIRYRISGRDAAGKTLVAPAMAERTSNYGYFVYDALPAWRGAINPKSRNPKIAETTTFGPEVLGRIQVYHLLGKKQSIENVTWNDETPGRAYKYTGTLVADGVVYDHVRFRARGGIWRYALGKNMWKIDLPAGEELRLKDDLGRPYPVGWTKLNLRSCFQLGAYGHRGEQGMFEAVNFRLWNMVGVEAPLIHWVHLRIIDEPEEAPADQYRGDFWGLYQAIENEDGRFLKTHDLPDGNIYKMRQGGGGELNHQGKGQPGDGSDLGAFLQAYENGRPTDDWWRKNLNLEKYYSYRALIECVHHYDIYQGKNYDYYRNPKTGLWQVLPWDADLTWADMMHGDGEEPFNSAVLTRRAFLIEYRNRVREIRDLLFNPEQINPLIDEVAAIVWDSEGPNGGILEADRRKWDFHPAVTSHRHSGQGRYYQVSPTKDFAGMLTLMKRYVVTRGAWVDRNVAEDSRIPATPTVTYTGEAGYPAAGLRFKCGEFTGQAEFAAVKWRIAEVTPAEGVKADAKMRRAYEINALWESGELKEMGEVAIPTKGIGAGRRYRVRARMKDATGRWSHWSAPVEFTVGRNEK